MMAKLRGMAAEFRASFDEMARQSELDELRREVAAMREGHFTEHRAALEASEAQISQTFDEIHQGLTQDTAVAPEPVVPVAFASPPTPALQAIAPAKPKRATAKSSAAKPAAAKAAPAKVAAVKVGATKTAKARTAKPRPKSTGTSA
jgi:sec-independent protein translocase protein TatB